jgi:uncharacterized protein (TIGR02118 family)
MIIRSAILEGTVAAADQPGFDHHMEATVLPAIARYPGIIEVRLRRPVETEAGAAPVYMIFDLYFDSLEAMHEALASPVRQEVRTRIGQVMSVFSGKVYHLIMEEGAALRGVL